MATRWLHAMLEHKSRNEDLLVTKLRLIGDIHGAFDIWKDELIKGSAMSVQVGDFGIGFPDVDVHPDGTMYKTKSQYPKDVDPLNHRFIRGNHDDPNLCLYQPGYIDDGHTEIIGTTRIMYIGGALSIDKAYRTQGIDFWENEELSYQRLEQMIDIYTSYKPNLVVTHECPESVSNHVLGPNSTKFNIHSRTRNAFESMFNQYQPDAWYFGHWHKSYQETRKGTYFRCLNINEWEDVNL